MGESSETHRATTHNCIPIPPSCVSTSQTNPPPFFVLREFGGEEPNYVVLPVFPSRSRVRIGLFSLFLPWNCPVASPPPLLHFLDSSSTPRLARAVGRNQKPRKYKVLKSGGGGGRNWGGGGGRFLGFGLGSGKRYEREGEGILLALARTALHVARIEGGGGGAAFYSHLDDNGAGMLGPYSCYQQLSNIYI